MIPAFPLAGRVNGRDLLFMGRDILTGLFFDGFPDDMPLTNCWQKHGAGDRLLRLREQEAWHQALLTRGVCALRDGAWHPLTPELVQRLGEASGDLVLGYFSALGWIPAGDKHYRGCDLPMPADVAFAPEVVTPEARRALVRIPGKNVLWIVKEVAQRSGTGAHRVWRSWPVSDFIWSFRVSLEPELTKKGEEKKLHGLTPEMASIGTSVS